MKTKRLLILFSVSLFISAILINGCTKENEENENTDDNTNNMGSINLSPDKTNITPFEIITITAEDYSFENEVYNGSIGDRGVELMKNGENNLVFLMPSISGGKQLLKFVIDEEDYEIEFNITALPTVDNPEEVITVYKEEVTDMLDNIEYYNSLSLLNVSEHNIQIVEDYLSDFEDAFTTATNEEKQELAQFMEANPDLFDFNNIDFEILNDSLNTGLKDFIAWDQRLTSDMQYFTSLIIVTSATITLFNGALLSGNPILIAIATAAVITEFLLVLDQTETILNRSYKPFEFDIYNQLEKTNGEYNRDEEYILAIDAMYRTLYDGDQGSSEVIIELVANINTFASTWNDVVDYVPGLEGEVMNLEDQSDYESNQNPSGVTPPYVSIPAGSISNFAVSISDFSNTDVVRVTFTTSATEDQEFTFDIVYNHPDFSSETITVNAMLKVPPPPGSCPDIPTITYQGQVYNTIQIGSQCWLKENMKFETGNSWCYGFDPFHCSTYGRLYDWNTAMTVCPEGWRLPSAGDWEFLANTIGSEDYAGGELKQEGYDLWNEPNIGATNNTGFTALPGGTVYQGISPSGLRENAYFWTSSPWVGQPGRAYYSHMNYNTGSLNILKYGYKEDDGNSVRCIKN